MSRNDNNPRSLGYGAIAALTLALVAPGTLSAAMLVGQDHPDTDPVRDSPFGTLVYESSSVCAAQSAAEVAFVGDRVIAQTDTPERTRTAIDRWISNHKSPAVAAPVAAMALAAGPAVPSSDATQTRVDGVLEFPPPDDDLEQLTPVTAYDLPGDGAYDILALVRSLRESGIEASPDYVVRPQHHDFYMPDGTPTPTTDRLLPRAPFGAAPQLGQNVRVTVFDTGVTAPGRIPSASAILPGDVEDPDADGDGIADDGWVGHGQAISSLVWSLVPGAEVTNARVTMDGVSTDWSSAQRIVQVLENLAIGDRPHLVLASFGTQACDVDPGVPGDELLPLSLRGATEWVDQLSDVQPAEMALIGAAGNHGTVRRQFPAAFPSAIAVGALDTTLDPDGDPLSSPDGTGHIADFSGRGRWVDVYAPGVDITTQHVGRRGAGIDFAPFVEPGSAATDTVIEGRAIVQGTSFAVPAFAAAVAEQMADDGQTVWDAVTTLTSAGEAPLPPCDGTGGKLAGVAVVWNDVSGPITDAPAEVPTPRC